MKFSNKDEFRENLLNVVSLRS